MNSLLDDIKKYLIDKKGFILCGAALTLTLSVYSISWHVTIISFGSFYSVLDVADGFLKRTNYYLLESFISASAICIVLMTVRKSLAKKIFIGLYMTFLACSEIIRMVDWGSLYFMGNHIDSNFWAHAFYTDGLVFLIAKESVALYAAAILFFTVIYLILKKMYLISNAES